MRYIPGNPNDKITEVFFTEGSEYMDLDGKEYRGYIHILSKNYYSEKTHTDNSILLIELNQNPIFLEYFNLKGLKFRGFIDPVDFYPAPNEKDYTKGFIERYFIRKRNENSKVQEVDKKQFDSLKNKKNGLDGNRYVGIKFNWKISGPKYDVKYGNTIYSNGVYDTNKKVVELNSIKFPGLDKKLTNFLEFARIK